MPVQLKRLLLLGLILVGVFIILRKIMMPVSFGEYGHYRGDAIKENQVHATKYMGNQSCASCHDSNTTLLNEGYHMSLSCEVCHGPGYQHNIKPEEYPLHKPGERSDCARCHSMNKARAKNAVIQQDVINHHSSDKCIKCHNPHQP